MSVFYLQQTCDLDRDYSVVVEDNGRVAYAYIMQYENIIVADVWLYNQAKAPANTNWHEQEQTPYLNPAEYLKKDTFITPIQSASELYFEWDETDDGLIEVNIYIRSKLAAVLLVGNKPGWSTLVVKDGPLALVY